MSFVWPKYSIKEANAVRSVILSNKVNYWTGENCLKFEKEFAEFCETKYAIALANGTVALEVSLKALGIGVGDEVIVSPRTFIASASSIVNVGAKPIFADVDIETQNINIDTILPVISKKTKAIICVHHAGWPCDMDPIIKLAKIKNYYVIEDCAQAHGAKYKGKPVGSLGDVGCWSFCQDKIITTGGEGGMVTTNNHKLWSKIWSMKDHGKNLKKVHKFKNKYSSNLVHDSIGTNLRMTEMQAVLGRIQLKKIYKWNKLRNMNSKLITQEVQKHNFLRSPKLTCKECDISCKKIKGCVNAAYKSYYFVNGTKIERDNFIKEINSNGIPCYTGSSAEIYLEKAFKNVQIKTKKRLKNARKLGETSIMFLCHPTLTKTEIKKTCDVIKKTLRKINKFGYIG